MSASATRYGYYRRRLPADTWTFLPLPLGAEYTTLFSVGAENQVPSPLMGEGQGEGAAPQRSPLPLTPSRQGREETAFSPSLTIQDTLLSQSGVLVPALQAVSPVPVIVQSVLLAS
jgi:hypothetical protein